MLKEANGPYINQGSSSIKNLTWLFQVFHANNGKKKPPRYRVFVMLHTDNLRSCEFESATLIIDSEDQLIF